MCGNWSEAGPSFRDEPASTGAAMIEAHAFPLAVLSPRGNGSQGEMRLFRLPLFLTLSMAPFSVAPGSVACRGEIFEKLVIQGTPSEWED